MTVKVIKVDSSGIQFEEGYRLSDSHEQSCCESHYLDYSNLTLQDFSGLEFDLSNDKFLEKIEGYGIGLVPVSGFSVKIPGYGSNNGYYGSDITLNIKGPNGFRREYDVSECQQWDVY